MDVRAHRRADRVAAVLWTALGLVAVQQSWVMDRLEAQGADPWSVPGLVPGIIGGVLTVLGLLLLARSLRQPPPRPSPAFSEGGSLDTGLVPPSSLEAGEGRGGGSSLPTTEAAEAIASRRRLLATLALCLLFVFGLLGHGLPFWLATALFIAAFVLVFTWRERRAAGQLPRGALVAAVYGLVMGVAIHLLFQELFLVRLP